ncbi:MAG: type II toxin-antitoxin system VapC family toxin [Betaproteobacteria bacterium]|nr:type II toxin-antitoxin system VapC family toxin [Betaproteobacteria bacterium]
MVVIDTHALIWDALDPARLSRRAKKLIEEGFATCTLACSDISLWEIAMLMARKRLHVPAEPATFLSALLNARAVRVLPITPEIAVLSQRQDIPRGDPADRIICATALHHGAKLLSADKQLRGVPEVEIVW